MSEGISEATRLLRAMSDGDARAASALLPLIYDELRRLARARMVQERPGHTLQATALVHEAYLRLMDDVPQQWDCRAHFFTAAGEAMRRILIEHARARHAQKRGGGQARVEFPEDSNELPAIESPCADFEDLLALDEAMNQFTVEHPDKAALIKLLYFAGLSLDDAAAALAVSKTTAHRHAVFARAWLYDSMERTGG
jgi:RNA polymerase sigma factor (TIGR02999 family)